VQPFGAFGGWEMLDRVAQGGARDGLAVLPEERLEARAVSLPGLAQELPGRLVHKVFWIGEVLSAQTAGQFEPLAAARRRNQRHQGRLGASRAIGLRTSE
jgi:hypothetical protein